MLIYIKKRYRTDAEHQNWFRDIKKIWLKSPGYAFDQSGFRVLKSQISAELSWGIKLIFYMHRYQKKQPNDSYIFIWSAQGTSKDEFTISWKKGRYEVDFLYLVNIQRRNLQTHTF